MAAVNEAVRGVNELANKQMGAITGGLKSSRHAVLRRAYI